jgi:TolA-binding protein
LKRLFLSLAISLPMLASPLSAYAADAPAMPKALLEKYDQGVAYFKHGDLDLAIAAFKVVALSMPDDPLAHLSI